MKISISLALFVVLVSCSVKHPDLDTGCLAYFPFNHSIAGTCHDSSAIQVINTALTSDRFGNENKAGMFNGENSSMLVQFSGLPAMEAAKSVSWWFLAPSVPRYDMDLGAENMIVLADSTAGIGLQFGFRASGYGTKGFDTWEWGGSTLLETDIPVTGVWHHCVYTHDGSEHRFYVDGLQLASSQEMLAPGRPIQLMLGNYPGGDQYYRGKLDEVRIYDRVLNIAEVKRLYTISQ